MADEDNSDVKKIENCFATNPSAMPEESSMETVRVMDVGNVEDVIPVVSKDKEDIIIQEINEVPKPQGVTLRRFSTGAIGTRATKPQVQSRYRGNHHGGSIHDLCKHGKRCDQDDAVKPWKMVKRKTVQGSEAVKDETLGLRRKSLGSVSRQIPGTKPESSVTTKRDALVVKRKPCASVNSESSSVKEDSEIARSVDGLSVKSNDKTRKSNKTQNNLSGSAVVKKVPGLRNEKSYTAMEKVSRISDGQSSRLFALKNLKNKEKSKTQTISSEDVKEKTVCVVESSIKGVLNQKQPLSEKKPLRSGQKSLTTPTHSPTKQIPGKISLTKKIESGSTDLGANPKPVTKIRPMKTEVKVTPEKQLNFKRGKVLEPKPEDSSRRWMKFKKRVVQELKTQSEGRKKKIKDKQVGAETKSDSFEGSKREKVVLRHRKVEGKKKRMTLFNNVIEETMIKLTKVRKDKVKALIGAFETVISLQDTKTSHKPQNKATTSASKVSPLGSEQ